MRALLVLLALSAAAITLACGDDDTPAGTISPIGTKSGSPTETVAPSDGEPGVAPDPAEPSLDEALAEFTSGEDTTDLGPGETYAIDTEAIAAQAGTSPSCDNFQFDFTWQVQDPYPTDNVALVWQLQRDSGLVPISQAPAGEQAIGCDVLQALNNGAEPITLAIRYKIGGLAAP